MESNRQTKQTKSDYFTSFGEVELLMQHYSKQMPTATKEYYFYSNSDLRKKMSESKLIYIYIYIYIYKSNV